MFSNEANCYVKWTKTTQFDINGQQKYSQFCICVLKVLYLSYLSVSYVICSENKRTTIIYIKLVLLRTRMKSADNVNHVTHFQHTNTKLPVFLLTIYVKLCCFCSFYITIGLIREHITYYVPKNTIWHKWSTKIQAILYLCAESELHGLRCLQISFLFSIEPIWYK
jgi:4-amino-4-deoxy-L-arabinose transferase-like glycosyltransferase